MSQDPSNLEFRQLADSFIDVANKHSDKVDSAQVGSSMVYACARFSSFVVASHSKDLNHFESEIDNAVEFFSREFKRMLTENMEEYKTVFTAEPEEASRYEHLMKKDDA
jgi:isopenicillin N synthase-like dioxygenase